ncbi:hypothetical protein AGABI1DRAFT_126749 [Agaricus bisporus var. burnettii JB137-S8]|uniref:Zn(2)-C6 fungal-type domain-containing protein n=1 Tax=Agaricus bisporus var. burnettii (strain JB137-S8 / ATCC MYA-4627 / FGSC 10392) TaxID=597362 RepID=K5W1N8_AGABU|nr:uncharacterized protein AGABI1DRAFT_126749 [Agaricus bisporus var. burnettii JB137-S8]EKM80699.1 hypothetical protein AGABI1DRAFT_126749 [Agaricus bisporus var. burnettii JB137-S8]
MGSDGEQSTENFQPHEHVKRRRLHGACDICRRRKIKCNSAEMPNRICSNCITDKLECTHNIPRHTSKKEAEKGYIHALEERLSKMEELLHNIRPEMDMEQSLSPENSPSPSQSRSTPRHKPDLPYPTPQSVASSAAVSSPPRLGENDSSEEDDLAYIGLAEQLGQLSIDIAGGRFFGNSSALMLLQQAHSVKEEATGQGIPLVKNLRRRLFWDLRPWETEYVDSHNLSFEFPEKPLLDQLVSLFFERLNIYFPLLHRPTFERDLNNHLHLHDVGFAQVVLMVCALSSRHTNDPSVFLPNDMTSLSGGFRYFRQTCVFRNKLLDRPSLFDLQYLCLVILYLITSLPQAGWNLIGIALRLAQERGLHRRRGEGSGPTAVSELWGRCFWVLIMLDRLTSSLIGRPCAMHDEDFDADLPVECDDEYWECADPGQNWNQPPGKPSKISAFNTHLRLCEILSFALRTLYSTKKSKLLTGLIGNQWEQHVVAELDSAMNNWKDSLLDHLRWNPHQENTTFLHQSAWLHTMFYYIQIQIHRPFIQKASPLSFPSLAICTNAARACSHIVDAKGPGWIYQAPSVIISTFASGIILSLHLYGGRRAGLKTDWEKEIKDIQRCINALHAVETSDVLTDLVAIQDGSMTFATKFVSDKRSRDADEQIQPLRATPAASTVSYMPQKIWSERESRPPPVIPTEDAASTLTSQTHKSPEYIGTSSYPSSSLTAPHIPNIPQSMTRNFGGDSDQPSLTHPPSSAEPGQGWDLSNLLLAQMNFGMVSQAPSSIQSQMQGGSSPLPYPGVEERLASSSHPVPGYDGVNQDVAAFWSDVPSSFNVDDWNHFVTNLNGSTGIWDGSNPGLDQIY